MLPVCQKTADRRFLRERHPAQKAQGVLHNKKEDTDTVKKEGFDVKLSYLSYFFTYETHIPDGIGFALFGPWHLLWLSVIFAICVRYVWIYKKGDEYLHLSHKEIFFDRHNRGYFIREKTVPPLLDAEGLFKRNLKLYSESSWAVETGIKLEYVLSLKAYIMLFFTEE